MVSGVFPILTPSNDELFNARIGLRITLDALQSTLKPSSNAEQSVSQAEVSSAVAIGHHSAGATPHTRDASDFVPSASEPVFGTPLSVSVERACQLQLLGRHQRSVEMTRASDQLNFASRNAPAQDSVVFVTFVSPGRKAPNCTSFVTASVNPAWSFRYVPTHRCFFDFSWLK